MLCQRQKIEQAKPARADMCGGWENRRYKNAVEPVLCGAVDLGAVMRGGQRLAAQAGRQDGSHASRRRVKARAQSYGEGNVIADKESVPILAAEPRHFLRQYVALGTGVIAQNNAASRWQAGQGRWPVGKPVKIGHHKPPGKQLRK